jgi:hypothetical protein
MLLREPRPYAVNSLRRIAEGFTRSDGEDGVHAEAFLGVHCTSFSLATTALPTALSAPPPRPLR